MSRLEKPSEMIDGDSKLANSGQLRSEELDALGERFEDELLGRTRDSLLVHDLSGNILYAGNSTHKTWGYTKDELLGMSVSELDIGLSVKSSSKQLGVDRLNELLADGKARFKSSHFKKDGSAVPVEVDARVVEAGNEKLIVAVVRDISGRKGPETALHESEEPYHRLSGLTDDAIFLSDAKSGLLVDANQRASELSGYTVEELIKMPRARLHPPEQASLQRAISLDNIEEGQKVSKGLLLRDKNGRDLPVEISSSVIEIAGKSLIKSIFRDLRTRRPPEELSASLNKINKLINSTLDFDEILNRVVTRSAEVLGSETMVILLRQENEWTIRCGQNIPAEMIGVRLNERQIPHVALAARTQNPVVMNDLQSEEYLNTEFMQRTGIRSTMVVPLIIKDEVVGCKTFSYHSGAVPFTSDQIDFAVKLASSISLALENARLYEEQKAISDTFQQAVLILPERLPNIEFGHLYRSATKSALVGGDFYDLFALHGNRVALLIGDVSGKGLEAATLTLVLKNMVKAYAYEGHSPAVIMSKINAWLVSETEPSMFVSAFMGVLETSSGILTYCCAGHPPPLISSRAGTVSALRSSCPVLGIIDLLDAQNNQAHLHEGDLVTLFTDGVTEARTKGRLFGDDKLGELLKNPDLRSPTELPHLIIDELISYGCEFNDDVAIMSISLTPNED